MYCQAPWPDDRLLHRFLSRSKATPIGTLIYGPAVKTILIDDRDLAHLQIVMLAKLRRGEGFSFSWDRTAEFGSGHNTVWIHPSMYVEFNFFGSRKIPLNRVWVDALMKRANSTAGLELISETDADPAALGS